MKKTLSLVLLSIFLLLPLQAVAIFYAPTTNIIIIVNTTQDEALFNFTTSAQYPEPDLPGSFILSTTNFTDQQSFSLVSFNSFNFTEALPEGWKLDNITCISDSPSTGMYVNQNSLDIVPAGWENIECSFNHSLSGPSLNPVLFIPGIMGTEIFKESEKLWPDITRMFLTNNDRFMDPLAFDSNGDPIDHSIQLGDVLKQPDSKFDYTKKLIEEFAAQNYELNKDLFLFPYDWREDISKNANQNLKQKIDEIFQNPDVAKLDIVAHSQGGLLIKRLIYDHPEYQSKIRKLVFLGTPHLGAPKAAKALLYGDSMGVHLSVLGLDPGEVKRIGLNMPSIYQLLPSQEYFKHSSGYWGTLEVPWFSNPVTNLYDYQTTKDKLKADGYNSSLLDSAEAFHESAYDNFNFSGTGIDTYNIMGCQTPTIKSMLVRNFGVDKIEYGPGDGTVPIFSANNTIATENFYATSTNDIHGKMPSLDGIRQKVVNIITGSSLPTNGVISSPLDCKFNGKYISIHSPVDLHIYDELGNHVGPLANGTMEFNIPGVAYDIIGHEKFAFLPEGNNFKLNLIATDNGSFSFHSAIIENEQTVGTAYYSDIAIASTSIAQIDLNSSNTQTIQLDLNGDGAVDQVVPPSSVLDENQSQDLTPPISTSTLSGIMGEEGYYRSNATITLSSIDPIVNNNSSQTSGVLKTQYNLDNLGYQTCPPPQPGMGCEVVVATDPSNPSPFGVKLEGLHTLSFFATDKAGNNEEEKTINFTIDKTSPEFSIQFNPLVSDLEFKGVDNLSTTSKLTILDQDNIVTIIDQAGNKTVLTLKEKDRKKKLRAEVKLLSYNNQPADVVKTNFKFSWEYDKNNILKTLDQHVKSKKDFNINAEYKAKTNQTKLQGRDRSGKVNITLPGLVLLKVTSNKGDFNWSR